MRRKLQELPFFVGDRIGLQIGQDYPVRGRWEIWEQEGEGREKGEEGREKRGLEKGEGRKLGKKGGREKRGKFCMHRSRIEEGDKGWEGERPTPVYPLIPANKQWPLIPPPLMQK